MELSADFRLFFSLALAAAFSPISRLLSPLILGLLLDLSVVGAVKLLVRHGRPPYNPSMSPAVSADHFSFPNGHASRVFFVASLVSLSSASVRAALGAGENIWDWIAAGDKEKAMEIMVASVFAWAAVTSSSRVLLGWHYLLDVMAGFHNELPLGSPIGFDRGVAALIRVKSVFYVYWILFLLLDTMAVVYSTIKL